MTLCVVILGVSFPMLREADANFSMDGPPEWKDGDNCFSCRTEFGLLTRKVNFHYNAACAISINELRRDAENVALLQTHQQQFAFHIAMI